MLREIQKFISEDKAYFLNRKAEIAAQNNHMLINGSIFYAVVLIFYTIMTSMMKMNSVLVNMYYAFDIIHAALCLCIFLRPKRLRGNYSATQHLCMALELSVLGFFALEGAYASSTQHSLYVPIALLLVLLLFKHDIVYTLVVTAAYLGSFAVLSYLYKTPEASRNDLYITAATFVSAIIGYALIAQMRYNEAAALQKLEKLSRTDMLTGLLNKTAVEAKCEELLSDKDRSFAFVIVDLDNFKRVNDVCGHDVGDEVLLSVGAAMREKLGENDFIGRFGGDEFIMLLGCEDFDAAARTVGGMIEKISALRFSAERLTVQCSAGIAMRTPSDTIRTIFKRADEALYKAKGDGKGKLYIKAE